MPQHRSVRADWLYATVRECQAFAGDAFVISAEDLEVRAASFLARLPSSKNGVEALLLRGLLLEMALQYSVLAHRAFHQAIDRRVPGARACLFLPARALDSWPQDLTRSAHHAFQGWARRFASEFAGAHPLWQACRAEHFIETRYAGPIRQRDLARLLRSPATRLQRTFVSLTGMSLREFQTVARVRNAVRLLETTEMKVDAIAREVGYGSKKDLYRVMRTRTGLTPLGVRLRASLKTG